MKRVGHFGPNEPSLVEFRYDTFYTVSLQMKLTICESVCWPISPPNVTMGEIQAKKRKMIDARHCMLMPSLSILAYMRGL